MFFRSVPKIRETPGEQEFKIFASQTNADGVRLHTFLEIELDQPDVVLLGGLYYYNKHLKEYCLAGTRDFCAIHRHCSYTFCRIFPQDAGGRVFVSSYYVNLPLFYAQKGESAFGFSFRPFAETASRLFPFFFSILWEGGTLIFSINAIDPFWVHTKSEESFTAWREGGWGTPEPIPWDPGGDPAFQAHIFYESLDSILRGIYRKEAGPVDIDITFHFNKVRRHLLSVWAGRIGAFASSNARFSERTFHLTSLPLFDTLASGIYLLAKALGDVEILRISELYKRFLLSEKASVLLPGGGRVWHNRVRFNGTLLLDSIYNTGIAGFPGGQATLLRSLFTRYQSGDRDPKLLQCASEGADWLCYAMFEDGHWARSYRLAGLPYSPPESETGEASLSIGGNAEGSLALLLAYKATQRKGYLQSALKGLEFTNRFSEPWPIAFGYLRDSKMFETDGISSIFAILANLEAHRLLDSKKHGDAALRWAWYLLTWIRIWGVRDLPVDGSMDPLISSFKPRVSAFETALAARALLEVYEHTGDRFWLQISEHTFHVLSLENAYRGYSEGLYITLDKELKSVSFESSYATSAVLDYLLKYLKVKVPMRILASQEKVKSVIHIEDTIWKQFTGFGRRSIKRITGGHHD